MLDRLHPDFPYLWDLCDRYGTTGFYPYAMETGPFGDPIFFARQFPKRAGYPEDPATGVAASALGAYLAQYCVIPVQNGWNRYAIRQGDAMGRPSILYSDIWMEEGIIRKTRVCGTAYLPNEADQNI